MVDRRERTKENIRGEKPGKRRLKRIEEGRKEKTEENRIGERREKRKLKSE